CKKEHDFGKWFAEDIEYPSLSLDKKFDLIISADVIEHLVNPNKLLDYIHLHSHPETLVILSTPERDVTRGEESLGPPTNPAHVREWNISEFRKYISSCGFSVLESFVVKDRDDSAVEKCQVILCRPGVHSQQRWMREPDLVKHHTSTADVQPEDIGQRHTADNALDCFAKATEEFYKGHFETAVECMHKYRTTVDYSKFTRTFAGSRQDQKTDVSVIVVTYNRSEDLKRCLISLSRQDRVDRDFEVIVVDNGGSDFESLKQYVDQYIECPINFNLSEGRNIGVCCAKGRIVAFLDDDAVVPSDYVSSIKAAFETYDIFGLRGKALPKSNPEANKDATGYDHGDKPFATFCDLEGNSAFLRDVYLSMNGMDPLLFGHEGSDLTYRIAQKYNALNKVIYWPRTVIYHDAVAGDCLQTKKDRYELMDKYLKSKHGVDISRLRKTIENQPLPQRAPKFSFVMIVLNGIPLIEYSLKSIYDFAHEIIIVEGAVQDCMFAANADGSSKDGTVQFIKSFPDPANKIKLIQGKWPEKCEMQNEALKYVTGNYVWLIDSDEVYKRQDLEKLREILKQDPSITQVNFIPDNFWKGLDYTFVSHKFFEEPYHYRRLFKYQPGALFTSHRPPTMLWPGSKKTTENMHLLDGKTTRQMGIVLYHYSYVLDKQAKQKIELYHRYGWGKNWNVDLLQWYNECFLKWTSANRRQIDAEYPIWTGDVNSHTLPFQGSHPQVMIDYILNRSVLNHGISDANHIMHHVVAAVEEIKNRFNSEPILAIETGTIRSYDENHVSTYHIAKALANSGRLISVDISTDSIRRSGNICYEATNIELVQSDSVQYLSELQDHKFHFAFLDSVNDKDVIFEEFSLIVPMMEEHAILMVDDAGITGDGCSIDTTVAAQKGHRIWQFLTACGVHPSILDTPGGHGTQLKVVLTGDNLARIKQGLCSFDSRSVCHGSALDMPDAPNADYNNNKKKVLIVRSDSIGDFVIFGGAIPYYRKIYPNAHVAVVVAETVAELAEACPFIDEVITFNRPKICSQPEYAAEFISLIRQKKFDVAICPAFSRDKVSEYIAINSGAAEKITCSGDTANLPADIIEADNAHFTKVIPMSEGIALETFRNEEFLRGLGVELDGAYRPAVWVTKADREAAQQLLSRRRIRQPIAVVPFAQLDI
ncbi:MAG: glycosyltransferase, partial [Planctomycetota bacterium]